MKKRPEEIGSLYLDVTTSIIKEPPKLAPYISMSPHERKNDPPKLAPYISMSLNERKNDLLKLEPYIFDVTTSMEK